jgi:hypothetical protein
MKAGVDALLFADTGKETADLKEFIHAGAKQLGVPLHIVGIEGGMGACIALHRAIPSSRLPFCSMDLKIKPCNEWLDANAPGATLVYGYTWDEMVRIPATKLNNSKRGFSCEFPLVDHPYPSKAECLQICKDSGLPEQKLYAQGFPHNNCGGACVKAGISQWRLVYQTNQTEFDWWVNQEQVISELHGKPCTILKRFGKPYALAKLAADIESQVELPLAEWGGCGCFSG